MTIHQGIQAMILWKNKQEGITHFIGLKPEAYCYKVYRDEKEYKKSKGVIKHRVSNQISYKTYEETLNRNCKEEVSFNTIRSKNHQIYSVNQTKNALSNYDNKRYWHSDFESLPFGHYAKRYLQSKNMVQGEQKWKRQGFKIADVG